MPRCPEAIEPALAAIITHALLTIRNCAMSPDGPARCFAESDHVHNLPQLISDFSLDKLKYYLGPTCDGYLRKVGEASARGYQPMWKQLEEFVASSSSAKTG